MPAVAVVIPTLDEEAAIGATLDQLLADPPCPLEVVVADGGSRDATLAEVGRRPGVRALTAARGRGVQMNAGARATSGDPLVFLHADTRIGRPHLEALLATLAEPRAVFGSFAIRYDDPGIGPRLVAAAANLRTRLDRTAYGDQALFVRRAAFAAAGGFPEVALMEDVLLARRLRAGGEYRFLARPKVLTSARRLRAQGLVGATLRNAAARLLFELGVPPDRLHRLREGIAARG